MSGWHLNTWVLMGSAVWGLGCFQPLAAQVVPDNSNISMDGGRLNALGGRAELGGLANGGTVSLNVDGNNLSLSFPDSVARSNVFLSNGAQVYVTASDGGSIAVDYSVSTDNS